MVDLKELLELYSSRTQCPSILGTQLQGLLVGADRVEQPDSDPIEVIQGLLANAGVIRCGDYLEEHGPPTEGKWGAVYPGLCAVRDGARGNGIHLLMGSLVAGILRAFTEFGVREPVRGLMQVYRLLNRLAPKIYALPANGDLILEFMDEEKGKKMRRQASEVYADALLAASRHVERWNASKK